MQPRTWIIWGALFGGLGVIAGAFGAHGLEDRLTPERLATFEVAVRYQMYHALALVLVGVLAERRQSAALQVAGYGFLLGVLIFSGLLYALVLTGYSVLGAIVPIGGVSFIVGWFALAAAAISAGKPEANEP
jgi:uncharacterized membrane protein YgdD (TMEM256/DUF423 family)